jgi:hypothetical protein
MINFLETKIRWKTVSIDSMNTSCYNKGTFEKLLTISTLFSSLPGSDEIRQIHTAHARISGPASLVPSVTKLDINTSICWISVTENTEGPCLGK